MISFWCTSDRNVKSEKYSVCLIKMDPKNKSSVTHSRGTCVCDHCGLKLNRHNLKAHTQNAHPGFPVKERVVGIMSLTQLTSC